MEKLTGLAATYASAVPAENARSMAYPSSEAESLQGCPARCRGTPRLAQESVANRALALGLDVRCFRNPGPRALHDQRGAAGWECLGRAALLSWQSVCELGFRGTLGEWERLMDATPKR